MAHVRIFTAIFRNKGLRRLSCDDVGVDVLERIFMVFAPSVDVVHRSTREVLLN